MLIPAVEPAVLSSSLQAVTELLTCCGLGVLATHVGLLDAATTRSLAKCVFNIFLPAMLFTSVSRTVASGASLSSLLPMPLAALLQIGLGLILVTVLLGGPKEVKTAAGRDMAALSSFGNSGVLPLVFANCLFRAQPVLLARANSLVAMFLLGWSPLFWTLGYGLLAGKRDGSSGDGPSSADEDSYWTGAAEACADTADRRLPIGYSCGRTAAPPNSASAARGWRRRTFAASSASMPRGFRQGL